MPKQRAKTARQAKVLSSELLFQGRVFALKRERVEEPNGVVATREIVVHGGSSVVLPVLHDGRIVLIRQYRHAAGQYLWELVAGHKDPDEDFLKGAGRELEEETGYRAKKITKLFNFFPSPGLLGEKMEVFLAEGLTQGKARPEDDEKITKQAVTLREANEWIRTGKICDGKTIAGVLYYAAFVAAKR